MLKKNVLKALSVISPALFGSAESRPSSAPGRYPVNDIYIFYKNIDGISMEYMTYLLLKEA